MTMTGRSRVVFLWSCLALLLTMAEALRDGSSIHKQLHGLGEKTSKSLRRTQAHLTSSESEDEEISLKSSASSIHLQLHELSEKKRDRLERSQSESGDELSEEEETIYLYQNNSNHTNTSTPTPAPTHAPTPSNHTPVPSPHTPAPSSHTPAPSKHYHPKTDAPSTAPSMEPLEQVGFFRMMGKMLAWCILLYLGVLFYGFCINHKYQIAYYARHAYHFLQIANHWLIQKIRPDDPYRSTSHNLSGGYAAMYASERNDALAQSLFDNPHGDLTLYEQQQGNNYNTDRGFVMGQQHHHSSGMGFSNMG